MSDIAFEREIDKIIVREGGWKPGEPGDYPTKRGVTFPEWKAYCEWLGKPELATEEYLKASTLEDARSFYRWYFLVRRDLHLNDLPVSLLPQVLDMHTMHSPRGCAEIMDFAFRYPPPTKAKLCLSRIRYMMAVAERDPRKRKYVRGWVDRALNVAGWGYYAAPEEAVEV